MNQSIKNHMFNEHINTRGARKTSQNESSSSEATIQLKTAYELIRKWDRDHTADQIIENPEAGVRTKRATQK